MRSIMGMSAILSMLFCTAGLIVSYALNLPSGAVIILVSGLAYVLAALLRPLLSRKQTITIEDQAIFSA